MSGYSPSSRDASQTGKVEPELTISTNSKTNPATSIRGTIYSIFHGPATIHDPLRMLPDPTAQALVDFLLPRIHNNPAEAIRWFLHSVAGNPTAQAEHFALANKSHHFHNTEAFWWQYICGWIEDEIEDEEDGEEKLQVVVKALSDSHRQGKLETLVPKELKLEKVRVKQPGAQPRRGNEKIEKCRGKGQQGRLLNRERGGHHKKDELRRKENRFTTYKESYAAHVSGLLSAEVYKLGKVYSQQVYPPTRVCNPEKSQQRHYLHLPIHIMAAVKKFAGLPDVDEGAEVYETQVPELTEASTLPTESDAASDEDTSDLDRRTIDPDAARRRFGPAIVDASNTNFSDTINGGRKDYKARTRRRRKRAQLVEDKAEIDGFDESEDETLQGRLARLRREATELQAEIDSIEQTKESRQGDDDDSTYEDTVDHPNPTSELSEGAEQLNRTLKAISLGGSRKRVKTLEEEFTQKLDQQLVPPRDRLHSTGPDINDLPESSISAIAAFSDRLTAMETVLGVSVRGPATTSSIIPTLESLSTQIEALSSTLTPPQNFNITGTASTSTIHLEPIAQRIRHLVAESKRLEDSRCAATKSFEELLETRDRYANLLQSTHVHSAVHTSSGAQVSRNSSGQEIPTTNGTVNAPTKEQMQSQFTTLFLDDQAARIAALYSALPTIQSLQPLLPVVLEHLRALSVIHTGAADVKNELDDVERRLETQEQEVKKWREAVEDAEKAMQEGREVMKENVQVVGDMVSGIESRVRQLKSR
ncbi:hypothetical protein LTR64_004435 [Lithohypha guttulata]|uniref:uncharacterized protein n=1 Tax=Lithohypha guttulata TaxID=1690604 RepID=UPI002DE12182|nr:hypothetical protein LTR51_006269 [Lithohypha guttulata]